MTPAERALLLAVAKTLRNCLVPEHAAYLYPYILAVEAEADDDISRVYEEAPIPPASALDSWQPSYNKPVEAKACENCGHGGYMVSPVCACCVRDRNNLFQFPHWKPKPTEAVCPTCNDANRYGDYEGPPCDDCNGTGRKEKK